MLEKEYSCTWLYMSLRRFLANPAEAMAAYLPASAPKTSGHQRRQNQNQPCFEDIGHVAAVDSRSLRSAMIRGMTTSMTTSRDTKIGALMDTPLNSRMLFIRRLPLLTLLA